MKVGRIVFGVIGFLVGAAAISGSLSILIDERDADDFFVSSEQTVARTSHAVISEDVDVLTDAPGWLADWLTNPVDVRVTGSAASGDIFLGIADTDALASYLSGVSHDEVTSLDFNGDNIEYATHAGSVVPAAPAMQSFWVATATGPGEQTLDWSLETGNWSVAVMNANAAAGIDTTMVFGAKISNFVLLSWIGLGFGVLSALVGMWLIYVGMRSPGDRQTRVVDLRGEPSAPTTPTEQPTIKT